MNESFLHILLVVVIFWAIWSHVALTAVVKRQRQLKDFLRVLKHETRMNTDIYPNELNKELWDLRKEVEKGIKEKVESIEEIKDKFESLQKRLPQKKYADWTARIEGFVVVVAIAFAFRAVILQPFKIPTNSMRPTLHGINVYLENENKMDEFRENYLYPIYFGRSYFEDELPIPGATQQLPDNRMGIKKILFTRTFYTVSGNEKNEFPGKIGHLGEAYQKAAQNPELIKEVNGFPRMAGYVETGDNLFVNRYVYNLREPQRGDIAVFETKNIRQFDGSKLGGQFYIKRLAGLPGDTLKIDANMDLYLKKKGEQNFTKMDSVHHGFGKVMSKEEGYRGYKPLSASDKSQYYQYSLEFERRIKDEESLGNDLYKLTTAKGEFTFLRDGLNNTIVKAEFNNGYKVETSEDEDIFTLGPDQYFMLGDNSFNSLDSRMWGAVPRQALMGTAFGVFWPFSKRWGRADK